MTLVSDHGIGFSHGFYKVILITYMETLYIEWFVILFDLLPVMMFSLFLCKIVVIL